MHDDGIDELFLDSSIEDSQLRMIFACCHPHLSRENQIALTLKSLCGFGVSEIARALLVADETVKKRLQRATRDLIDRQITLDPPEAGQLIERLDAVHQVLYLIFNEGYSSSQGDKAIRDDLCEESVRLCHMLYSHPRCSTPTTRALLALMLFHAARLDARLDDRRGRSCSWRSRTGRSGITVSSNGHSSSWTNRPRERTFRLFTSKQASRFIIVPPRAYALTNWAMILRLYDALIATHASPVYLLNRAIVVAEIEGPRAGIRALEGASDDDALRHYYLFYATLGEFYRRAGDFEQARHYLEAARQKTASPHDRAIIDRRLAECRF